MQAADRVERITGEFSTVPELMRAVVAAHPDREAFVDGTIRLTFSAWDRAADRVATALAAAGVAKGDVVCLALPSSADYAVCYQAAMRLGAITSGINPRLGPNEITSILARTSPRVTVVDEAAASLPLSADAGHVIPRATLAAIVADGPAIDPSRLPHVESSDPIAIVWTSGTTGQPKGAVFDHVCLKAMVDGAGALSEPGDRRLSPLPFAHVAYMTRVWDELVHVITTVIVPTPWTAVEGLRIIERERVTVGQGVPSQWQMILALPEFDEVDLSSLRLAGTGAARAPAEMVREMRERLGCPVIVRYASTEASLATGSRPGDPDDIVALTVGRPSGGVALRLVESGGAPITNTGPDAVGVVQLRSRAQMRGYWKDPEQTATVVDDDGWLTTGDLGWLDDTGNLTLVGRQTEMFIRGGYNVYPAEVEAVLSEHPMVARVAVVAVSEARLGEIGVACVVPVQGKAPTLDELRTFCRLRLASYKAPDRLTLLPELPLTPMLKVDKRALLATLDVKPDDSPGG